MGNSVLVFVGHSSEDKEFLIDPLVNDLEDCYINVWLDKKKIMPGDNLRKSIFRDGLDKADLALIFFTQNSLKSSWMDKEIKHLLREERNKENNFDLSRIISIFDSEETHVVVGERYPELMDDLMHLMPVSYSSIQLGQLLSAIWSKYISLQGGGVIRQHILEKDREMFKKEQTIQDLTKQLADSLSLTTNSGKFDEFDRILKSGMVDGFISNKNRVMIDSYLQFKNFPGAAEAHAFGLISPQARDANFLEITEKGRDFFKWILLNSSK